MNTPFDVAISAAVEGNVDEVVVKRLIEYAGVFPWKVWGKNGKKALKRDISGYNYAARHNPWIVVIDLNNDADCAPPLLGEWLDSPAQFLCFRVAVREIESWLLADSEHISRFLKVSVKAIPSDPEDIANPKQFMVNLARQSKSSAIREDMVPRPESGREIGPAYTSRLIEFVISAQHPWRPEVAVQRSDSLARSVRCLQRIIQRWRDRS